MKHCLSFLVYYFHVTCTGLGKSAVQKSGTSGFSCWAGNFLAHLIAKGPGKASVNEIKKD